MQHLALEQDRRREADKKEKALRAAVDSGELSEGGKLRQTIAELEKQAKEQAAAAIMAKFEVDRCVLNEQTTAAHLAKLAGAKAAWQAQQAALAAGKAQGDAVVLAATTKCGDVEAEREFYRISSDRLKVENSVLSVKISQLEARSSTDRSSMLNIERQYCAALETLEVLKREAQAKTAVYQKLDQRDEELLTANTLLRESKETDRAANERLRGELGDVSARYDAIKGHEDAARTEQLLQQTLVKLDRTKGEMQQMLVTQMKLSSDLSMTMGEQPDVSGHRTHHGAAPTAASLLQYASAVDRTMMSLQDASVIPTVAPPAEDTLPASDIAPTGWTHAGLRPVVPATSVLPLTAAVVAAVPTSAAAAAAPVSSAHSEVASP
jgi:hypothetical protein